jgi:hypothetical protein
MSDIIEHFQRQAAACSSLGSPFTAELLERAAADMRAGGVVARLLGDWPGKPQADGLALRLAGGLHAAVLTGRCPALAEAYPASDSDWSMERVWPLAESFLVQEAAWMRGFLESPPQTNETGRATALTAAFLWLAARAPQPFHMLELGASAGLNLAWDTFAYLHPAWGRSNVRGPVIPTEVAGPAPDWRTINVAQRAGCDQNPLDLRDPEHWARLRAYVWADQPARLARLEAAAKLALASGVTVETACAADWSRARLAPGLAAGLTVVYHSVFLQYPPKPVRDALRVAIEAAGEGADADHQLAWVRFEPEAILGGRRASSIFWLNVVIWDERGRRAATLADVDPHGRSLTWRG